MDNKRRQFLTESAKLACQAGLIGLGVGIYARQAQSTPPQALRPPGALPEPAFQAACVRCGLCVRDCPYHTLKLAQPIDLIANGTPFFIARDIPCEMCDDIPCVKICPTGALDPSLKNIDKAQMGLAVLIDQENCLNFLGLRCDVCYRVCPLIDKAITLNLQHNQRTTKHAMFMPTVHSNACTGCGKCEKACVLEIAAIKVVPRQLALGELGEHYRLGWEEKRKAGHSLIPEQLDLPDRMPDKPSDFQPLPLQGFKP